MPLTPPAVVHEPDTEEWYFTWPDQPNRVGHLVVGISNLRESSSGMHADLEIEAEEKSNGRVQSYHVFGPKTLNLKGPNSARDIVKILADRTKGEIDEGGVPKEWWELILEQVCHRVVSDAKSGFPIVWLHERDDPGPVQYAVERLIPEDANIVIAADGGSNKGNFAVHVAMSWALGKPLGSQLQVNSQGRERVLYLDWEDNEQEALRRFYMAARGHQLDAIPKTIIYRRMTRGIREELATVRETIRQHSVGLVIVDSLGPAAAGKLVDEDVAQGTMTALRRLAPANRLIIAHVSHADARGERGPVNIFGSVFFKNMARMFWEFTNEGEGEEYILTLLQRKVNRGPKHANTPGVAFRLTFDDELHESFLGHAEFRESAIGMEHASIRYRMRVALERGAMTTKELAEELDEKPGTIWQTGRRDDNIIRLPNQGKDALWGLKS